MVYDLNALYAWRNPVPQNIDPQATGEYFESLYEAHGKVEPERVVDEARDSDALLHPAFEWDDTKAAQYYRTGQAQRLIGNLVRVAVSEGEEKKPVQIRAFVNVSSGNHKADYKPVSVAMGNCSYRSAVLENARKEAAMYVAKYKALIQATEWYSQFEAFASGK